MRRGLRGQSVTLTGVKIVRRNGREYRFYRRPGWAKGDPLPKLPADLPLDHPDFLAAYAAAVRDAGPVRPAGGPAGSLAALIVTAGRTPAYRQLTRAYRMMLLRNWDAIRATPDRAAAPVAGLRPRHVRADLDDAPSPQDRLKAWRFLARTALDRQLADDDFTAGVRAPRRPPSDGHPPWSADDIDRFRARWPIGTVPRAAMELLFWTGARISDAVTLGPGMVGRDGVLAYRQSKTGGQAFAPWSCPLPDYAAGMDTDRREMHRALAALPGGHMTFLATSTGRTRSSKSLGTVMREAAQAAGLRRSAHGLRKSREIALVESGATVHQAAAWTGHQSLKEVERYTRSYTRRRMVTGTDAEPLRGKHPAPRGKSSA